MTTQNKWIIGLGIGITSIMVVSYIKRHQIASFVNEQVWDLASEARINALHPSIRNKVREFINKAEKAGYKLRVTSGYRTYQEQQKLYDQGRTAPGTIVTRAKPGESSHNFATAVDVVEIKDGQLWGFAKDYPQERWKKIAAIGKSVGFAWGGDWKDFVDMPHFEMNFGKTLAQLRKEYESGDTNNGYVKLAA